MFIRRESELEFLDDKYEAEGGQLVVLYGGRRVEKTETLREFCKGKPHIFFSCTQTSTSKVFKVLVEREYSGTKLCY